MSACCVAASRYRNQTPLRVAGALLALTAVSACRSETPAPPRVAEPQSALRPEPSRGIVPADARIADYVLTARLDTEAHRVEGSARVTWHNTTGRTVDSLPFHLYMNAFRAEDTAWMLSSRGRHRRSTQSSDGAWGYIDIGSVRLVQTPDLQLPRDDVEEPTATTTDLEWSEDDDPSTMTVTLPGPVSPGQSVTVHLDFTTQLPRVVARTGYHDDFYAVGQWFPKIGVLEEAAGWQAHTFTHFDEFYADFGYYEVTLDVPEQMIVGATGVRTAEEASDAGRKQLTYVAEMVHDFVWMADPDFVQHDGEYRGIRVRQLIQPERQADAEAHLAAQIAALESYENRYGPYPWSTITIVHPPEGAEGASGMEYPTLFTTSNRMAIPEWVRNNLFDERVSGLYTTIHEFGHQYFQGLLASREHRQPWLDEGLNTFSNDLAIADRFGDEGAWGARLLSQKLHVNDIQRTFIRQRGFLQPLDQPASSFSRLLSDYGATVYARTSALMMTLRNLAGPSVFDPAFRVYCDRYRFRHPRGQDLEEILVAELGEQINVAAPGQEPVILDVRQYLDQALRTNRQVDFAVLRVVNRVRPSLGEDAAGWHRSATGALEGGEPPDYLDVDLEELADDEVQAAVVIQRIGEFELPIDLRIEFADGTIEERTWDGRGDLEIFEWPGRRVQLAVLDPNHKLILETQRLDNSRFDRNSEEHDGLSQPAGDFAEALSLALMGGLGL